MRKAILAIIDFFHPPLKKYISLHNFRYLATGGSTFVLGYVVYYLSFYHLFKAEEVDVLYFTLKRGTAAMAVDFAVAIPYSFIMNRYVVFTHSEVRGRVQLFRFMNLQFINILLNISLYKFLADVLLIYPTVARFAVQILLAGFSYIYQHYFTFSVKKLGKKG
ncbi:GtrA family protein [Pedobacter frigiditerrae]|uniref:GtrA family protein n=1 Tax=Pedobacter frigiditerrae TaxID=2530452 RepID=A0A4R0MXW1_9SPHI|nr:GtrA family protein [Pedobacter frigiditerrae]TCC92139.1 GtrA family protein [Pedobacter frigiditerrae]